MAVARAPGQGVPVTAAAGPAPFELVIGKGRPPVVLVHGGAGSYLRTTTPEDRAARGEGLRSAAIEGLRALREAEARGEDGARAAVLAAVGRLEEDERFNAGRGSRLQRDGRARLSASLMDGRRLRLSAVYNVQGCLHPSALCAALQERGDRNLDGEGARALMEELGIEPVEVRTQANVERWQALVVSEGAADPESAVGNADAEALARALDLDLPMPPDLLPGPGRREAALPPEDRRHGTVGAVAVDAEGRIWACTSTGGRGHEAPGRVSDSPTPAGNYACPELAVSATGFGEQILDLDLAGRLATRVADGVPFEEALRRTLDDARRHGALLGFIAAGAGGEIGYGHTTEAMGVAWVDAGGEARLDVHSAAAGSSAAPKRHPG